MKFYRGTNGDMAHDYGEWYAAAREYAEFFGGDITTITDDGMDVLDLRGMGVGGEYPTHMRVQDAAQRLAWRYDAVRVLQFHSDYGTVEDTLLVF